MKNPSTAVDDERRDAIAFGSLAVVVRLCWLVLPATMVGDSLDYWQVGSVLASTGRFSYDGVTLTSFWPPLYPGLIALLIRLIPHPDIALVAIQILAGSITSALAAAIASRAFGRGAGVVTGIAFALAPMSARFTALVYTETLFSFFLVWAVFWWQRNRDALAGIALGLATLTRASSLPFILLIALIGLAVPLPALRRSCRAIAVISVLTIAPWVLRNVAAVGHPTVADASWGSNLLFGTVPIYPGANRYRQLESEFGPFRKEAPPPTADTIRIALTRIETNPARWLVARSTQYPWLFIDSGDYLPVRANATPFARAGLVSPTVILKLTFIAGNLIAVLLALRGMWLNRGRWLELLPLWLWPVYYALANVPMFVEPRYGLGLVPFTLIFAGAGVRLQWTRKWRNWQTRQT